MPRLVDSHAHLDDPCFESDLDDVLERAREAGVEAIVTVGTDVASSERAVALADKYRGFVYAAVGLHPHEASSMGADAMRALEDIARCRGVVGVGETGLDYHYENAPRMAQLEALRFHLGLAQQVGLPLIVHCRRAFADCLGVLEGAGAGKLRGVAHCFSGSEEDARRFLAIGFDLSFSGTVTFTNARKVAAVARSAPIERILIETDCPYLAPQPRRGQRNEPAHVTFVAEGLARVRGESVARICEATFRNACALFRLEGEERNA